MKILVTGGGTGGHIYPAIALVNEIRKHNPDASFLYIGTEEGLESEIVPKHEIPFKTIKISGFKRKISFHNIKTVARFLKGAQKAKRMIRAFQPDIAIGTGGYVAGPVIYAAAKSGVPSIIHEQNSVPGLTNKFLSRYVDRVAISFQEAQHAFPKKKTVFTGNPRASEVVHASKIDLFSEFGFHLDLPVVLIVGGSRGARPIHDAFIESLSSMEEKVCQFLYVTGSAHYDTVKEKIDSLPTEQKIIVRPFIHNMPSVLASVDTVVSRAGATTLSEITALGIPSILVPSPYVTANHQEKNARALEKAGAAIVHKESEWSAEQLQRDLQEIFSDKQFQTMQRAAKSIAVPDAADRMYRLMQSLVDRP